MSQVYIIEAARTPVGKKNGSLKDIHPVNLAAIPLRELVKRAGVDATLIEDVILGCVSQVSEQTFNIARNALLTAGYALETPGVTIDRQCGSSQQAAHFAAALIASGANDILAVGGVESMSRIPLGSSAQNGHPYPKELLDIYELTNQGIAAERIADTWNISRRAMEEFALESHRRAAEAQSRGAFTAEIAPVPLADGALFTEDEGIRPQTSLDQMAALKPVFLPDGKITAAVSSQISDGAAALLLASENAVRQYALKPRARIVAHRVVGSDPVLMLTGPVAATERILRDAGIALDEIGVFEVNEAFACVPLMWLQETHADPQKMNVNGGAIALGHPLGATGAKLLTGMLYEMERRGARYGLQTMCCGGGMATATIIELL